VSTEIAEIEPEEEDLAPQEADDEQAEDPSLVLERLAADYDTEDRKGSIILPFLLNVKEWAAGEASVDQANSSLKSLEALLPKHDDEAYQAIQSEVVERLYAGLATGQLVEVVYPLLQLARDLEEPSEN
jgi:hypothetical protein